MVLEIVLVTAVLAAAGYAGVHAYQQYHLKTSDIQVTPPTAVTNVPAINGVVSSLTASAEAASSDSLNEGTNLKSVDSSTSDTTNVGGAYDESQF